MKVGSVGRRGGEGEEFVGMSGENLEFIGRISSLSCETQRSVHVSYTFGTKFGFYIQNSCMLSNVAFIGQTGHLPFNHLELY